MTNPAKAFQEALDRQAAELVAVHDDTPRSDTRAVLKIEALGKEVAQAAVDVKLKAAPRYKASGDFNKALATAYKLSRELTEAIEELTSGGALR